MRRTTQAASIAVVIMLCSNIHVLAQQTIYDTDVVQKFEIFFSDPDWDNKLDTLKATTDGYLMADSVIINGNVFDSIGIKYKGNSSYNATSKKNSFTVALDKFADHEYQDLKEFKLNNCYLDPSLVREALAYQILSNYMKCSRANFAEVYVNGDYKGVFTNVEDVGKAFCADRFASKKSNTFIKCSPIVTPGPTVKSNLKYISEDTSAYANFYEMKSSLGWKDLVSLCRVVSNAPDSLEDLVDMDAVLWMLAFNTATLNLDSYMGAFSQNYYLFKQNNGQYVPIVWDMNMSFGGFPFVGSGNSSLGTLSIPAMKELPLSVHANDPYYPLIMAVQQNPTWRRMFVAHTKTIVEELIESGLYETWADTFKALVTASVQRDTCKSFTNEEFETSLDADVDVGAYFTPGIVTLMDARAAYLTGTPEFMATAPGIGTPYAIFGSGTSAVVRTAVTGQPALVTLGVRADSTSRFTHTTMYDDGLNGDGAASDGVYAATITDPTEKHQYYIYAENEDAGAFSPARARHEYYTLTIETGVDDTNETPTAAPYPNPASSQLNIPASFVGGTLYSMLGVQVSKSPIGVSLDVSALPNGVYILRGAGIARHIIIVH